MDLQPQLICLSGIFTVPLNQHTVRGHNNSLSCATIFLSQEISIQNTVNAVQWLGLYGSSVVELQTLGFLGMIPGLAVYFYCIYMLIFLVSYYKWCCGLPCQEMNICNCESWQGELVSFGSKTN